jgi:hypothetical protein
MSLDPRTARRGRVLAALVVAAVGLSIVAGGAAEAKTNPNDKKAAIVEAAAIQATVQANTREYTGTVDGTNAYIAVIVSAKDVEVYICDGNALSAWLEGKIAKDGTFKAEGANGIKVTGTISDTAATGTVILADGSKHAFTAPLAASPAGLYQRLPAKDTSGQVVVAATIVLADGTQRGAARPSPTTVCNNIKASWKSYMGQLGGINNAEALAGSSSQGNNYINRGCSAITGALSAA